MTLIFLANSDLSEQQRERLTSHLALRGIMIRDYTLDLIFTSLRTLFTSTKTGIADPSIRPGGIGRTSKQRSFYLFEAGEFDGEEGYWAVGDEDEEAEGLLSTENDTFWTLNPESGKWYFANLAGRKFKRTKGKNERIKTV